jgi:hypothetical protein
MYVHYKNYSNAGKIALYDALPAPFVPEEYSLQARPHTARQHPSQAALFLLIDAMNLVVQKEFQLVYGDDALGQNSVEVPLPTHLHDLPQYQKYKCASTLSKATSYMVPCCAIHHGRLVANVVVEALTVYETTFPLVEMDFKLHELLEIARQIPVTGPPTKNSCFSLERYFLELV